MLRVHERCVGDLLLDVLFLVERKGAAEAHVHDDAHRPHVQRAVVAAAVDHLRRQIGGRAHHRAAERLLADNAGKTEIAELDLPQRGQLATSGMFRRHKKNPPEGKGLLKLATRSQVSGHSGRCVSSADTAAPPESTVAKQVKVKPSKMPKSVYSKSCDCSYSGAFEKNPFKLNKRFETAQIHLCDQEARDAFREPPQLAGQDHVQHVSVQLLHGDEDVLRRLEHALHQDHSRVGETLETKASGRNTPAGAGMGTTRPHLQDGGLVPQLPLVFAGKSGLIDNFDGDQSARLPVSTCGQHEIHSALFTTVGKPKSAPTAAEDGHKRTFVDDSKLPRTQHLVCEDLINGADVLQHRRHTHTHLKTSSQD